ncbi:MAG: nitrate reductase subunit alpha [Deltaproteobacteria bacterium]|nr:nitrate reductase subunit alpha [Deltaproteobacteria bacterium]
MATLIQDIVDPSKRGWEEFYRNRWQHDKIVRSTHGNNCTGGCSWMVYVKDGIITWELQATDYPLLNSEVPPYEPRGCQRGISSSWYVYSPVRVKYPYIRSSLLNAWRDAKSKHSDSVEAWASIVDNAELHKTIKQSRGKGGFRRYNWEEAADIITSAQIHTIKKWGPDRNISFSVIPAMSQISYASGARYHQLIGGVSMSFYDYYTDLPPSSPEIWGEQTDVGESADWHNAGYVVILGATPNRTRTADCHFVSELRHGGAKCVVMAPDYSEVTKYADLWVPVKTGSDGAFWMAINHVILKEFYVDRQVDYFVKYQKEYTDNPHLVKIKKGKNGNEMGRLLKACDLADYADTDNPEWKFAMWDNKSNKPSIVYGGMGFRYPKKDESHGKWNTMNKDEKTGDAIDVALSLLDIKDGVEEVNFYELDSGDVFKRQVPVKYVETKTEGRVAVTTVFDMQMSHFGVPRAGLSGDFASSYDDDKAFSPAWQEKYTGIGRDTIIQVAREWAANAEVTKGRSMIIVGASINHWYHADLIYRAFTAALMFCGCIGRNGGGMNHYVGQEKLAAFDSWGQVALGLDWERPPRLMNTPSFWYIHTQQWKYDGKLQSYHNVPDPDGLDFNHTADYQVRAVRMGHLPWYPQFNKNSIDLVAEAERSGAKDDAAIIDYTVKELKSGGLQFAVDDPDAPENWPRVWMIWRANALGSSARGQEYFFKFLLGTHNNVGADEAAKEHVTLMQHRESPLGKLDLIVVNEMRMNTTPTYCDIVLPAAHWYEKEDINTTDLHSFIHPMGAAVAPNWEAKSDWDAFKFMADVFSTAAKKHLPKPVKELVAFPLMHDAPDEITQPCLDDKIEDWKNGDVELIPGKTAPNMKVVTRDYTNIYNRYVSFGPLMKTKYGFHGIMLDGKEMYENYQNQRHTMTHEFDGETYISMHEAKEVADIIMHFSGVCNGEVLYRQWEIEEHHTGLEGGLFKEAREVIKDTLGDDEFKKLPFRTCDEYTGLAEEIGGVNRDVRMSYDDIVAQPRRTLASPLWTGDSRGGRCYTGYSLQIDYKLPWRTLTGRQHYYLDHPTFLEFGEGLVTHKFKLDPSKMNEIDKSDRTDAIVCNYITPHGKWAIHSTHYDNLRMLTLSRGGNVCWINDRDAESVGIRDNDWIEAYNDNGIFVCRAIVSARIPTGVCFAYHSMERTVNVPKAEQRNKIRGGFHNSLTRQRLKPTLMAGGYGQMSYGFNAWGPIPIIRDTTVLVRKMRNQEVKW